MEDWKREEEQREEKKRKKSVTRLEFYICFAILLILIFRLGIAMENSTSQLENRISNQERNFRDEIGRIPNGIESALREADNPLRESSLEIVGVDGKGKTATLRMTALPKEYQAGMGMTFFVSCDGKKALAVPAAAGEDRVFMAEVDVPFCGVAEATARVEKGDVESLQTIGGVGIQGEVLPYFSGNASNSVTWNAGQDYATFEGGEIIIDVQAPQWIAERKEFTLKNKKVELYVDGKKVKTLPVETVYEDEYSGSYVAVLSAEDKIKLTEGQTIEVFFRAEDENGLKYTYRVDGGTWNLEDGYLPEGSWDSTFGENLTVE